VGLFLLFLIIFICELSMLFFSFFFKNNSLEYFHEIFERNFFHWCKRLVVLLQVIPDGYMFFSYPYYSCEYGIYTQLVVHMLSSVHWIEQVLLCGFFFKFILF
jgi:hypothetical protein